MVKLTATSLAFVGLNVLRLTSLVVIVLVFTTLVMGFVEDVQAYHDGETMDEARDDDCAYVPGTWIPMQTWGVFWVALHRILLLIAAITLFFAELSWFRLQKLSILANEWMPCLSDSKGLGALGFVQVVVATSLLSHYLDEFPLVVGWMLFVVGIIYLTIGMSFRTRPLKDARSFSAERRQQAAQSVVAHKHITRTCQDEPIVTTSMFRKLLNRGRKDQRKPSINETFPTLEMPSHQELLREGMRRESHRRQASSVAIDIESDHHQVDERSRRQVAEAADLEQCDTRNRNSVSSCQSSNFGGSVASSTQVRIGGYATPKATLAREKAQQRRKGKASRQRKLAASPAPEASDSTSPIRTVKRHSAAFISSARSRLSGTPSLLAERRRLPKRGIPNVERNAVTQYIEDQDTAPPLPPLPAYHPASVV